MTDGSPEARPYINDDLLIYAPLSAAWARTLDKYHILWTYMPQGASVSKRLGRPCFLLNEMNMTLEITHVVPSQKALQKVSSWAPAADSSVITGFEFGGFKFRDLPEFDHFSLLMYCPVCAQYFFSPVLNTPCGFCGACDPQVQEYGQISSFDDQDFEAPTPRDLRPWLNDNLRDWSGRERPLLEIAPFPLAKPLLDFQEVGKAKARESNNWDKLLADLSGPAFIHQWPLCEKIEALKVDYPNFGEVCDFLVHRIQLSQHQPSQAVSFPNLLLVGGPSCGKSSFAERLARILVDTDFTRIDLGQATTNFSLVGSDSGFKNSKEGRILRLMAGSATSKPVRNPLVILDEVDKAFQESNFNPLPALLSLLEKRDARRFVDEFFAMPVDASGINFLALANTLQMLSGPLLSRFQVFQIQDYTHTQFVEVVIPTIYGDWCTRFYPGTFPQTLSLGTRLEIAEAAGCIPRQVVAILDQFVTSNHKELFPRPTWESLGQATMDQGVNHD